MASSDGLRKHFIQDNPAMPESSGLVEHLMERAKGPHMKMNLTKGEVGPVR